jgi:hypothetical protein
MLKTIFNILRGIPEFQIFANNTVTNGESPLYFRQYIPWNFANTPPDFRHWRTSRHPIKAHLLTKNVILNGIVQHLYIYSVNRLFVT